MNNRLERIDVLRGVAITLVVLHHFYLTSTAIGVAPEFASGLGRVNGWMFVAHRLGYLGVQLFFVLSGFCIHNSYLGWRRKTHVPTVRGFLLTYLNRRFWRIYPAYLIALIATFAWVYWPVYDARAFSHLALHASLTNTLFPGFFYNINPAFWSIAVECQLYLLYPALLWLNRRSGPWYTVGFVTAVAAFWRFALPAMSDNYPVQHLPFYWWFEWSLGFLIADLRARGRVAFPQATLLAVVLLPATAYALESIDSEFLVWLLPPLGFAALLQSACSVSTPLGPTARLLSQVGISSYSLYLLHNPVIWILRTLLPGVSRLPSAVVWVFVFAAVFAVMHLLAKVMFRFVEKPGIAIGSNLERTWLKGSERLLEPAVPAPVRILPS